MPYLQGKYGQCFYRHWSSPQPNAIAILIHGYGEHTGHYHRLANYLAINNINVWGIDHVGHGLSYGKNGFFESVDELSSNLEELYNVIKEAQPNLPIAVIGHSLGGITGTNFCLNHPDKIKALVALGTPYEGLPELDPSLELIMSKDQFYLDEIENDVLKFNADLALDNLWQQISAKKSLFYKQVKEFKPPVLLINGEFDCFAPPTVAQKWAELFPNAKYTIIPKGYHDIPNDESHREVAEKIVQFIHHSI